MARWLLVLVVAAVRAGVGGAVRCHESQCEPAEDRYCRLDDGMTHLAECHYANFLESLRHLHEYNERHQHVDGDDEEFHGPVVTADRMWCAKVIGVATHPSGKTQAVYRACVPRDGERCRELMQLATYRLQQHEVGQHVQVQINCSQCSTDACNGGSSLPVALAAAPFLFLLLTACLHAA